MTAQVRKVPGARLSPEAREKLRMRMLRWIAERETFSFNEVHQSHRVQSGTYVLPVEMRSLLAELQLRHVTAPLPKRRTGRRGRPFSQGWTVDRERVRKLLGLGQQQVQGGAA